MFWPPIVDNFRDVSFEGCIAQNVETIYKYKTFTFK